MELLTTMTAPPIIPDECEISSGEPISTLIERAELEFQATLRLLVERARFLTAASGAAIALEEQAKLVYCAVGGFESIANARKDAMVADEPESIGKPFSKSCAPETVPCRHELAI